MLKKITVSEYEAKLKSYHKDKGCSKIEINRCGDSIVLKRTYCENIIIKNIDEL